MTKLWCIAIAAGGPGDGMVAVCMQRSDLPEVAVALAVADVYRQTGTKLPLMGVNSCELTREYLEAALRAMDEDEQKPAGVVQLRSVAADYLEKHYGMKPIPPSEGPGPTTAELTEELRAQNDAWLEKSYGVRPGWKNPMASKPPEDEPA